MKLQLTAIGAFTFLGGILHPRPSITKVAITFRNGIQATAEITDDTVRNRLHGDYVMVRSPSAVNDPASKALQLQTEMMRRQGFNVSCDSDKIYESIYGIEGSVKNNYITDLLMSRYGKPAIQNNEGTVWIERNDFNFETRVIKLTRLPGDRLCYSWENREFTDLHMGHIDLAQEIAYALDHHGTLISK